MFALATALLSLAAYPWMFSQFRPYDDEGYVLISIKGFLDVGHLYDQVYSQYGPFFAEAWSVFFRLPGVEVTLNWGRLGTIGAWLLTSLLSGITSWRVTRSVLLGIAVQLITFKVLLVIANEPMHPGGLIGLLLAGIGFAATTVERQPRASMAAIGAMVGAVALTKANVGVFAFLAVCLACASTYATLLSRRYLRLLIEAACISVPLVLMASKLGEPWVRDYAAHTTVAIVAVVATLRFARPVANRDVSELEWLVVGFATATLSILAVAVVTGSGPDDLLNGIVLDPLHHPSLFNIPFLLADRYLVFDVMALAVCATVLWINASPRYRMSTVLLVRSVTGVVAGLLIAITAAGGDLPWVSDGMSVRGLWPLALAWVALLPTPRANPAMELSRRLMPVLAVLASLHAYPVAGAQVEFSSFLLVPVAAISFHNGITGLARLVSGRSWRPLRIVAATAAAGAAVLLVSATILQPLSDARQRYSDGMAFAVDGADRMRLPANQVAAMNETTTTLRRNCDSFLSLPGFNSFYFWTGLKPPTYLNVGAWMFFLDDEKQRRVVDSAERIDRLCVIRWPDQAVAWNQGQPLPETPLLRYISREFEPLRNIYDYEVLVRKAE
jgi:hypothetical protein